MTYSSFRHILVDAGNPADPHCKGAGDLDGDGRPDLVVASAAGGGLYWYRCPGWSKHKIADGSFTTDLAVADLDGDGFNDVIIPHAADGLMWFRNPLSTGGDPAANPWPAINISPDGAHMHDVRIGDLDCDGRNEIVTRHQSGFGSLLGNQVHLWKRGAEGGWIRRAFACPHGEGVALTDIDGDGRPDIIIGGRWYENPGDILRGEWREHPYMSEEYFAEGWTNGDVVVQAGDLNGDGRIEIALTPSEGKGCLAWFAPPPDPRRPDWLAHVIDPALDHAHGLQLGDLDGDGQLDIAVAKMHQASAPQEVCVYFNQAGGRAWRKQVISTLGSHNIALLDIDGTGRLSIFGANWNNRSPTGGAIELWLNELTNSASPEAHER